MERKKDLNLEEQYDVLGVVETLFVSLSKTIGDRSSLFPISLADYTMPRNFPKELGLKIYNQNLKKLISQARKVIWYRKRKESKTERERLLSGFKDYILAFRSTVDRAIEGRRPTKEDEQTLSQLVLGGTRLSFLPDDKTGRISPEIWQTVHREWVSLWMWVYYVWRQDIKVKRCKAEGCNRTFVPKRSDQEYCSEKCYNRQYKREKRALSRNKKITP